MKKESEKQNDNNPYRNTFIQVYMVPKNQVAVIVYALWYSFVLKPQTFHMRMILFTVTFSILWLLPFPFPLPFHYFTGEDLSLWLVAGMQRGGGHPGVGGHPGL